MYFVVCASIYVYMLGMTDWQWTGTEVCIGKQDLSANNIFAFRILIIWNGLKKVVASNN